MSSAARPPPSGRSGQPKRRRSSAGRYDAPAFVVLAHVAQDVGELHRDAEIVGELSGTVGPAAAGENRQAQPSNRTGNATTVADQLIEALVPGAGNVELDPFDQQLERVEGHFVVPMRVCERDQDGIAACVALSSPIAATLARSAARAASCAAGCRSPSPMSSTRRANA